MFISLSDFCSDPYFHCNTTERLLGKEMHRFLMLVISSQEATDIYSKELDITACQIG